jgi:hypothetical protein
MIACSRSPDVEGLPGLLFTTTNQEGDGPDDSWCDYYHSVATTTPADALPDDLDVLEVEPATWIAFRGEGPFPRALQNLWAESFSEWFPSNRTVCCPGRRCSQSSTPATTAPAGAASCGCRSSARTERRVGARGRRNTDTGFSPAHTAIGGQRGQHVRPQHGLDVARGSISTRASRTPPT